MDTVPLSIINYIGSVLVIFFLFTGCADLRIGKEAYDNGNYVLALENYQKLSDRGFPRAHKGMGDVNLQTNPKNTQASLDYYMKAYDDGYDDAVSNVAGIMVQNAQTDEDYKEIVVWLKNAKETGSFTASYELAILRLEGRGIEKDVVKGLYELNTFAENSYVRAHYYLASVYHEGLYLDRSDTKAIEHYEAVYKLGREDARLKEADIYADIDSSVYDEGKAKDIYLEFSEKGNGYASFQMARYFSSTPDEIRFWYKKSSAQGYLQGRLRYALLLLEGIYIAQNIPLALEELNLLETEGYLNANLTLGSIYHRGEYVKQDEKRALEYYAKASKLGELRAYVYAANIYAQKNSAYSNAVQAKKLYVKAYKLEEAKYFLGVLYESEKKQKEARKQYLQSAAQNYLPAILALARIDENPSVESIQNLSNKGYAPASSYLARLYAEGKYFTKDEVMAVDLYALAYAQGDKSAKLKEADLYLSNNAKVYQPLEAEKIYLSYAMRSHREGMYKLADFYENEEGLSEKSFQWYLKASNLGSKKSKLRLADMSRDGEYLPYDIAQALKEYQAIGEYAQAKNRIAQLYLDGHGVKFNAKKAIVYLEDAYALGLVSADLTRAFVLYNGIGVKAQPLQAIKIYQKHASSSNAKAAYELALIYELTLKRDKAIYWYEQAIKSGHSPASYKLSGMLKKTAPKRSLALLKSAVSMGNAAAQLEYAQNLFYGKGMKKNEYEGLKMVFIVVQHGEAKAIKVALDLISTMKNLDDVIRAYSAAKEKGSS